MQPSFSILRQAGVSPVEGRVAAQYAMTSDVPIKTVSFEDLASHADVLRTGTVLPIGSVEFVRKAMGLTGLPEPENMTYPDALREYLRRDVHQCTAGSVLGAWFVKPVTTKAFTGFVFDTMQAADTLPDHDREQHAAFLALPSEAPVWVSEPVSWLSEFRYYVLGGQVVGEGRYDDGPDDLPSPDTLLVSEMAGRLAGEPSAPVAFSLDVGVLASGETALVEVNDAWALGFYRGTLSHRGYVSMLWRRWQQLFEDSK